MRLSTRLSKAREKNRQAHRDGEVRKHGNLRAGSSGILTKEGDSAGMCMRKAYLRQQGIEIEELGEDKHIMFELGYANEDVIAAQLETVLEEGEFLLREEQIPVEWSTTNGTKVTGRPDIVVCRKKDWIVTQADIDSGLVSKEDQHLRVGSVVPGALHDPVCGLELKSVHSLYTARDVLFEGTPKLEHIVQAAHYMWKIGCPWKIMYKSYSQLGQGFSHRDRRSSFLPKWGEPGSEYIDWIGSGERAQFKHLKQFEIVYDIHADATGRIHYRREGAPDAEKSTPTIVTLSDIERFFEEVSRIEEVGQLPPRPLTISASGSKLRYSTCSYCTLKGICDSADKKKTTFLEWFEEVSTSTAPLNGQNKKQ